MRSSFFKGLSRKFNSKKGLSFLASLNGFSLVEIMIVAGVMGIMMFMMMTMQMNQMKANNFLQFQMKKIEIQRNILGQFLSDPNNCGCLFQNATPAPFSDTASNITLEVTTPPTVLGRYKFVTAGDCSTATIPQPLINSVELDGVKSTSIELKNITAVGGGFSGNFVVKLQSTKELIGPNELSPISIPVTISTTPPVAGMVTFQSCSSGLAKTPSGSPCSMVDNLGGVVEGYVSYRNGQRLCCAPYGGAGGGPSDDGTGPGGTGANNWLYCAKY